MKQWGNEKIHKQIARKDYICTRCGGSILQDDPYYRFTIAGRIRREHLYNYTSISKINKCLKKTCTHQHTIIDKKALRQGDKRFLICWDCGKEAI